MGTPGTLWSLEDIEKVREMHMAGASDVVIGLQVGRSKDSVYAIREKYEINRGRKPTTIALSKSPVYEKPGDDRKGCVLHLIDLMREYAPPGSPLSVAKANYVARNEFDVPHAYAPITSLAPWTADRSFTGSHFADVPR